MKLKVSIVENWREFWKWHSLYVFAFIAMMPDIWNLIVASGLLHDTPIGQNLDLALKFVALFGAILRLVKTQVEFVKQKQELEKPADPA